MGKIVWLASYPKSGNTWLRFIVTSLLTGRDTFPEGLRSMYADINDATPDVHYPDFSFERYAGRERIFFKTHHAVKDGEPLTRERSAIPRSGAPTERAVYLVRNPLDIVTSTWNHLRVDDLDRSPEFPEFFEEFSANGGYGAWTSIYGTWDQNVESWTSSPTNFPLLVVRYEDLLADPLTHFGHIAEFLKLECSPSRVRTAVESFSFQRLQEREDELVRAGAEGRFQKKGRKQGHRFFNVGKQGTHASYLTPDQIQLVRARFATTMAKFSY